MAGPGWWRQSRRHRWAAMAGWRHRRSVRRELQAAMVRDHAASGGSLVVRSPKRDEVIISTPDRRAISEFRENPQRFHILDVETAKALARLKAEARSRVKKSQGRVQSAAKHARGLKMKVRSRRDLTIHHKRRLERDIDRELARSVRNEHAALRRELRDQVEAGNVHIRVSIRRHWDPERKRRAERVATALGTNNLIIADLLVQRAARAGKSYDEVNWDAVQVGTRRPEFTEYLAQLEKQIGVETVTAGEAARMTEVTPGRFVDVDAEIMRYAEEYRDFLDGLVRRGEIPPDAVEPRVRAFEVEAEREASAAGAEALAEGKSERKAEKAAEAEVREEFHEVKAETKEEIHEGVPPADMAIQRDLAGGGQVQFLNAPVLGPVAASSGPGPVERSARARELQRLAEAKQEALVYGREFPKGQKSIGHYVPEKGKRMPSGRGRGGPEYRREEAREIREGARAAEEGRLNENPGVIFTYSDAQAIEDGVIVDLPALRVHADLDGRPINRMTAHLFDDLKPFMESEVKAGRHKNASAALTATLRAKARLAHMKGGILQAPPGIWFMENEVGGWTAMYPEDY